MRLIFLFITLIINTGICFGQEPILEPVQQFGVGTLLSAVITPDGKNAITSGQYGIFLWDVETGKVIRKIVTNQANRIFDLSKDGKKILISGITLAIYDAEKWEILIENRSAILTKAMFSSDAQRYITVNHDKATIDLYRSDSVQKIRSFKYVGKGDSVAALSPDGNKIAVLDNDRSTRIIDVNTGKTIHLLSASNYFGYPQAFTPDNSQLVTVSIRGIVKVWDMKSGKVIKTFALEKRYCLIKLSPDGERLICGDLVGSVDVWDMNSGELIHCSSGHFGKIISISFSADGARFLTASEDQLVIVWDTKTNEPIQTLYGHNYIIMNPILSKDGKHLLMDYRNSKQIVWNVKSGEMDFVISSAETAKYFPDDDKILAYSAKSNSIQLLNDKTGEELGNYSDITPEQVVCLPYKKILICDRQNNQALIVDLKTLKKIQSFPMLDGNYTLSPNKKMLLTLTEIKEESFNGIVSKTLNHLGGLIGNTNKSAMLGRGYIIKLWDIATGKERYTFNDIHGAMSFSPDSSKVAGISGGTIRLWDAGTGKQLKTIGDDLGKRGELKFTHDGKHILVMNNSGIVKMWNIETEKLTDNFSHNNGIDDYYFSPLGTKIVMHHGMLVAAPNTITVRDAVSGSLIIESVQRYNKLQFINEDIVIFEGNAQQKPYLFNLRTNRKLCSFSGTSTEYCQIDYSPGSTKVFISNMDGCMFMYDISEYLESDKTPVNH
jgi:WD40 repeat protein